MTTILRLFLGLSLTVLAVGGGRTADAPSPAPSSGKVLVLDNERTLEGDIDRVGDRYRIRRSVGVTWVEASRVLRLCASAEEAYAFLRDRSNPQDPDERLRLARWCHLNGLRDQAAAEAQAAVELRPDHAEGRRLLQHLEEATRPTPAPSGASPADKVGEARAANDGPGLELNAEALSQFARRVQPILMNTCASCHAAGKGGTFELRRCYEVGLTSPALRHNASAVLAQLNPRQPELSPLLLKAVSAHGASGQAPLRGRQAVAFQTLENWVKLTVSGNPQLRDRFALAPAAPDAPPAKENPPPPSVKTAKPREPTAPAAVTPPPPAQADVAKPTTPPEPTGPVDEFDPAIFNRQMHPGRNPAPNGSRNPPDEREAPARNPVAGAPGW